MLELPHTIVGVTIATKISSPIISLPLAFLSAFLVDLLPHWNPHLYTEMQRDGKVSKHSFLICLLDSSFGLLLGLFFAFRFWPDIGRVTVVIAGWFFAALPDLLEAPYFFLGFKKDFLLRFIHLQRRFQWNVPIIPGIISQIILVGVCLFLLQ